MAKYKCSVCGYVFDEEKEGKKLAELDGCPVCKQPIDKFELVEEDVQKEVPQNEKKAEKKQVEKQELQYDSTYVRHDASCRYMEEIHEMAVTGKSISGAMGTQLPMPSWDDILLLGAQLNPAPLDEGEPVDLTTVIGKEA